MVEPKCFFANYTFWTAYQHHVNQNINYTTCKNLPFGHVILAGDFWIQNWRTDSKPLTWKDFWLLLGKVLTLSEAVDKLCDLPQPPARRAIDLEFSKGGKKVGIPRFPRIVTGTVFWGCSRAIPRNHPGLFRHSHLLCLSYPQRSRRTTAAVFHTQEMIPFLRFSLPECFV